MVRPGEKAWTEHTTPFDRVQAVILAVSEPQSAEYIADEAAVSIETARNHLESLVELAVVLKHDGGDQPVNSPDPLYTRFHTIRRLLDSHTHEELIQTRDELQAQISGWRSNFDVASPDALRERAVGTDSVVDPTEARQIASDWELAEYRLDIITHLCSNYSIYTRSARGHE